jgi:hypothetical protein
VLEYEWGALVLGREHSGMRRYVVWFIGPCADSAGSLMSARVYVSRKVRCGEPISAVELGCRSLLHGSTNCACACAMRSKLGPCEHI